MCISINYLDKATSGKMIHINITIKHRFKAMVNGYIICPETNDIVKKTCINAESIMYKFFVIVIYFHCKMTHNAYDVYVDMIY